LHAHPPSRHQHLDACCRRAGAPTPTADRCRAPMPSPNACRYRARTPTAAGPRRLPPPSLDTYYHLAPLCRSWALPCCCSCRCLAPPSLAARPPPRAPRGNELIVLVHYARPPLLAALWHPHRCSYSRRLPFTRHCGWPLSSYIKVREICTYIFTTLYGLWIVVACI
jgi:hypothetical protein